MTRLRTFLALGAACAGWAAVNTADLGPALYLTPPLVLTGILLLARRPTLGGWFLIGACALAAGLGVDEQNGAWLAPALVAMYVNGRHLAPWPGLTVVAGFYALILAMNPTLANALFGALLFGGPWLFAQLIRRRAVAARVAGAQQARLETEDENAVIAAVVEQERDRLTADAIAVLRRAVDAMREGATSAKGTLDPHELTEVGNRGRAAVAELRRLLGLLRAGPPITPRLPPDPKAAAGPLGLDVAAALAVAALTLLDPLLPGTGWSFPGADLILVLPLVIRRTEPVFALVAASGVAATYALLGVETIQGFGAIAGLVLLAWTVGASRSPLVWAAGSWYATASLWLWWSVDPGNVGMGVVWLTGSAFLARAWSERQREFEQARAETAALLDRRDAAVTAAVADERLRIARELHDVTSHAVGVMVTQAGAAAALARADPAGAQAALDVVESAGREALADLGLLGGVLEVPTVPDEDLGQALVGLADRITSAGVQVELDLDHLPDDPEIGAVVYRAVQESLTNVLRHAAGAVVEARVATANGRCLVEVRNDAAGRPATGATSGAGPGFGLVGLAERVRALDGDLTAGPTSDGGFVVRAELPGRGPAPSEVAT